MNFTISSSSNYVPDNIRNGWVNISLGYSKNPYGNGSGDVVTAKVTFNNSDFNDNGLNIYNGKTFSEMENEMTEGSTCFKSDSFPPGTYMVDYSSVVSAVTTYSNLSEIQISKLACAVYLCKNGNYAEVVIGANETSFQSILTHYQISYKFY